MSATAHEPVAAAESQEPRKGRTANGRFAPGNPGGPGNPFGRQVVGLKKVVLTKITEERMGEMVEIMFARAIAGDMTAARILMQYSIGKPAEAIDPDRVDIDDFKVREDAAIPLDRCTDMLERLSAQYVNIIAEHVWPCAQARIIGPLVDGLNCDESTREGRREARRAKRRAQRAAFENGLPTPSLKGSNGQMAEKPSPKVADRDDGPPRSSRND
jgi:hypothetical protein